MPYFTVKFFRQVLLEDVLQHACLYANVDEFKINPA